MTAQVLTQAIKQNATYLCVGLDTDSKKIPVHLKSYKDPIFEFNRQIIDATEQYCVAYKPNWAFYEMQGSRGLESLERTLEYIPKDKLVIADAKRGDIGNTAEAYAAAFFENYHVDALTLSPYMGVDTIRPFLNRPGKWAIVLALTSNPGSTDFETQQLANGKPLWQEVASRLTEMASPDHLMFVAGATHGHLLREVRKHIPDHFLLIPGVGTQGGDLIEVSKAAMNDQCGILVNASRSILYADSSKSFAKAAGIEAGKLRTQMANLLEQYCS